ncbi:DUF1405 domain-containing protein [Salinithrix halophila]|uniref:DUF1405 domain-containing protein n=1 Tax=Salinithrix halophila TaxID=1485204 RepID=A0ABV8JM72_9BACL
MIRIRWQIFIRLLNQRSFLWGLFLINLLGTFYGYYWYKNQLAVTELRFLPFVPDSPTASAAFTLVLLLYLLNRRSPLMEAFAGVTLFKYGIWAVAMIVAGAERADMPFLEALHWTDWMLMASHLGMAIQGVLYSRFFTYDWRHLFIVAAWVLLNDTLDYGWNVHPWLPPSLAGLEPMVALFTFGMSIISLILFAGLGFPPRKERKWKSPLWWQSPTKAIL